jgi:hypothetical protein
MHHTNVTDEKAGVTQNVTDDVTLPSGLSDIIMMPEGAPPAMLSHIQSIMTTSKSPP